VSEEKQFWEMSYEELYKAWADKHAFGSKGAYTPQEAREIHNKWKNLGTAARLGL
jgi:hypothetical protein